MNQRLLLLLSLAANAALGAAWVWRTHSGEATTSHPTFANLGAMTTTRTVPAAVGPASDEPARVHWLEGNDAATVSRLHAEGFPPSLLYAVIQLRVRDRHAAALAKFRPPAEFAYWRTSPLSNDPPDADRAARRVVERQVSDELKQLLGPNLHRGLLYEHSNRERLYGSLSTEKVDQLAAINKDYGDMAAAVRERANGVILQEDRNQLALLEQERRADLAALMTPAELLEYDLRASPSATTVRFGLRQFEATEEEFRALVKLQLAFDAKYGSNVSNLSGAQQEERNRASGELKSRFQAALTPERYAEYEIKTDFSYSRVAGLIQQHGSTADPVAVVGAQRELTERLGAVRRDRTLTRTEREARLDALATEANERFSTLLGPQAFPSYKASSGPLNALFNRPAPKP